MVAPDTGSPLASNTGHKPGTIRMPAIAFAPTKKAPREQGLGGWVFEGKKAAEAANSDYYSAAYERRRTRNVAMANHAPSVGIHRRPNHHRTGFDLRAIRLHGLLVGRLASLIADANLSGAQNLIACI